LDKDDLDAKHAAFMRLFLQCEPSIYAFIRSAIFSATDANDVLQEVSMVLWKKFDEFEQGTRFDCWAMKFTRLQILRFRQKRSRDRLVFGEELISQLIDESSSQSRVEEMRKALRNCLRKLNPTDRQMLTKRYTEGFTGRTIAQHFGRSESAVSRTLNRIHTTLLLCLKKGLQEVGN